MGLQAYVERGVEIHGNSSFNPTIFGGRQL